MMLESITLENFRSYDDQTFHLNGRDGVVTLMGPNGAGKTNVIEAVRWAWDGSSDDEIVRKDFENRDEIQNLESQPNLNDEDENRLRDLHQAENERLAVVTLNFDNGWTLRRSLRPGKSSNPTVRDPDGEKKTLSELEDAVSSLNRLMIEPDVFLEDNAKIDDIVDSIVRTIPIRFEPGGDVAYDEFLYGGTPGDQTVSVESLFERHNLNLDELLSMTEANLNIDGERTLGAALGRDRTNLMDDLDALESLAVEFRRVINARVDSIEDDHGAHWDELADRFGNAADLTYMDLNPTDCADEATHDLLGAVEDCADVLLTTMESESTTLDTDSADRLRTLIDGSYSDFDSLADHVSFLETVRSDVNQTISYLNTVLNQYSQAQQKSIDIPPCPDEYDRDVEDDALDGAIKRLNEIIGETDDDLQTLKQKRRSLADSLESDRDEFSSLKSEYMDNHETYTEDYGDFDENEAEATLDDLRSEYKALEEQLDNRETAVKDLLEDLAALQSMRTDGDSPEDFRTKVDDLFDHHDPASLNELFESGQADYRELKNKHDDLKSRLEEYRELASELSDQYDRIGELEDTVETKEQRLEELDEKIDAKQSELSTVEDALDHYEHRKKQVDLEQARSLPGDLGETIDDAGDTLDTLKAVHSNLPDPSLFQAVGALSRYQTNVVRAANLTDLIDAVRTDIPARAYESDKNPYRRSGLRYNGDDNALYFKHRRFDSLSTGEATELLIDLLGEMAQPGDVLMLDGGESLSDKKLGELHETLHDNNVTLVTTVVNWNDTIGAIPGDNQVRVEDGALDDPLENTVAEESEGQHTPSP